MSIGNDVKTAQDVYDNWSAYLRPVDREDFKAQLEALQAVLPEDMRVPEGWKLVPVEPTNAMLEALYNGDHEQPVGEKWDAMLATSPRMNKEPS